MKKTLFLCFVALAFVVPALAAGLAIPDERPSNDVEQAAAAELDINSPEANAGQWGPVMDWTLIPIHAIVLPDGKVLSFGTDANGIQGGNFIHNLWDPKTNEMKILPNVTGTNFFCSNMAVDPETGNVVIMGGDQYRYGGAQWSGIKDVVMFDYTTEEVFDSPVGDMNYARWYGSVITLANGELLDVGGRDANFNGSTIPDVYNAETGFRTLPGAEIIDFLHDDGSLRGTYYYAKLWQASDGDVWVIESEGRGAENGDMFRMRVEGQGSVERKGRLPFQTRNLGPAVMYDVDKVIIAANDGWVWKGDLAVDTPTWERAFQMFDEDNLDRGMPRTNGIFVPLPDGRIGIVGGSDDAGLLADSQALAQKTILIWDPETNETVLTSKQAINRTYHSSALILPDGRIWSGGNGAPGVDQRNAEVHTPGYLFNADGQLADRPVIVEAPSNIDSGQTFTMTVDDSARIDRITAIKSGAATHGSTNETRVLKLDFEVVDTNTVRVSTPENNILIPGLWMLYTVQADRVPSEANMLGVDMVDLVDTDPVEPSDTIFYNIDDEQIDGPFEITFQARFDDVAGRTDQRVFDFGNGPSDDNIWFGQVGSTNDVALTVVRNGGENRLLATDAITEGAIQDWTLSVDAQGDMTIVRNGVELAQGPGIVPADVVRTSNLIGQSNSAGSDPMLGLVRNLAVTNIVPPVNVVPVIDDLASTLDATVTEIADGATGENTATLSADGSIVFTDSDAADNHTATAEAQGVSYVGTFEVGSPSATSDPGSVPWTFEVDDADLDSLANGQSRTQTYAVTVDDRKGGTDTAVVTITIDGSNDAPAIAITDSTLAGSVSALAPDQEGDGEADLNTGGPVLFDDADVTDIHSASFAPQGEGYRGTLSLGDLNRGSFNWTFTVNDADLDDLTAGQSITQVYAVTIDDGQGGTDAESVTVTINGPDPALFNVAPTIDDIASNLFGTVEELADNGQGENVQDLTAVGSVVFRDSDPEDVHTATFEAQGVGYRGGFAIGTPTAISNPGSVSWTFTVNDADLDDLDEAETLIQSYRIAIADGQGASASATVAVTLTGADDFVEPTIIESLEVTPGDDSFVLSDSVTLLTGANFLAGANSLEAGDDFVLQSGDLDFSESAGPATLRIGSDANLNGGTVLMDRTGVANFFAVGDRSAIGYISMAGDGGSQQVTLGRGVVADGPIVVRGSGTTTDQMEVGVEIGDGTSVDGFLYSGGNDAANTITIGDGVTIDQDIAMDGVRNSNRVSIGTGLTLNGSYVGSSSGDESVLIGADWSVGGTIFLNGGDDTLTLGPTDRDGTGAVFGGAGFDTLRLTIPTDDQAEFETAAGGAGWQRTADGRWDTGGRALTWRGVTFRSFERAETVAP